MDPTTPTDPYPPHAGEHVPAASVRGPARGAEGHAGRPGAGPLPPAVRTALGHDLLNAAVAVRGLLLVLDQDEGDRLTPGGRECLRRAIHAAGTVSRTAELLRAVAAPPPAPAPDACAEPAPAADLLREAAALLRQTHPAWSVAVGGGANLTAGPAAKALVVQALAEAARLLADAAGAHAGRCFLASKCLPGRVRFRIRVADSEAAPGAGRDPGAPPPTPLSPLPLRLLLVEQAARAGGGTFRMRPVPGKGILGCLDVPAAGGRRRR